MYHKSVALQYAERLEDVHIEKLVDHNCVSKDFENSTYTMESNTMDDVCASMCVPLPYQEIGSFCILCSFLIFFRQN